MIFLGIANFTDVSATFGGLIKALELYQEELKEHKVKIYVRRAGPNYRDGLRKIKTAGEKYGLDLHVYGPETHISAVVPMALGLMEKQPEPDLDGEIDQATRSRAVSAIKPELQRSMSGNVSSPALRPSLESHPHVSGGKPKNVKTNFRTITAETTCIVYGLQQRAVQVKTISNFTEFRHDFTLNSRES